MGGSKVNLSCSNSNPPAGSADLPHIKSLKLQIIYIIICLIILISITGRHTINTAEFPQIDKILFGHLSTGFISKLTE